MSWRIQDARHWSGSRTAPSVPDMNFEHSRWVRWGGPIFGLLWLWPLVLAFAMSDPSAGEIAAVAAGLAVFSASFLVAVTSCRPLLPPVLAMLVVAVALTLAVDDAFGWLFAWAGPAATVRLDSRYGRQGVGRDHGGGGSDHRARRPRRCAVLGRHRRRSRDQRPVAADRRPDARQ